MSKVSYIRESLSDIYLVTGCPWMVSQKPSKALLKQPRRLSLREEKANSMLLMTRRTSPTMTLLKLLSVQILKKSSNILGNLLVRFFCIYSHNHLILLKESFGLKFASQKLFPWKSLPGQLVSNMLVMYNWPADVIFPGEERRGKGSSKGISDLTLAECSKLIGALTDTSSNRLSIQYVPKMKGTVSFSHHQWMLMWLQWLSLSHRPQFH